MKKQLHPERVLPHFALEGSPVSCKEYGSGHINSTYQVKTDSGKIYILQRINKYVFSNPKAVMENVGAITEYLRDRVEDQSEILHFQQADNGTYYYVDTDGEFWRCYEYADGICLEAPESDRDFYESAIAFGRFQEMLADFPAAELHETIPLFHNTVDRYRQFHEALEKDEAGRAKKIPGEINFVLERENEAGTICNLLDSGELPLRVTHNDTKLNNVLIDTKTGEGMCVIDLDTVMPGLSINDFGDSIRFGANHCAEDEKDLSKMYIDLELFDVYAKAFLEGAGGSLTDAELEYLPWGAKLMTLECGIRFLTDYLVGDTYFYIQREGQNLDRCRTQFKLVADMEAHWDEMNAIIAKYRK